MILGLLRWLRAQADLDYAFRGTETGVAILAQSAAHFAEFCEAVAQLRPEHLRRIELTDVTFVRRGHIDVAEAELVIPQRLVSAGGGGASRALVLVAFSDWCIASMPTKDQDQNLRQLWHQCFTGRDAFQGHWLAPTASWFFANFDVVRSRGPLMRVR